MDPEAESPAITVLKQFDFVEMRRKQQDYGVAVQKLLTTGEPIAWEALEHRGQQC